MTLLQEPEAGGELVGGESRQCQALVRAVIVGDAELLEERLQGRSVAPGVLGQPDFERAYESFRDPVRRGPMPGYEHVHEVLVLGELRELLGGEVAAAVGDEELELRGEEVAQGGDDHLGGDLGTGDEERETRALPGTVIGHDEDGDPGWPGQLRWRRLQALQRSLPGGILLAPPGQDSLALIVQQKPAVLCGQIAGILARRPLFRPQLCLPLAADGLPERILLPALLEDLQPLRRQHPLLLPRWLLHRWLARVPGGACRLARWRARRGSPHELPHRLRIGQLGVLEHLARPGPFRRRTLPWSIDDEPAR